MPDQRIWNIWCIWKFHLYTNNTHEGRNNRQPQVRPFLIWQWCKEQGMWLPLLYWMLKLYKCPHKVMYKWLFQKHHKTSFQCSYFNPDYCQRRASKILWRCLLNKRCKSDVVDSKKIRKIDWNVLVRINLNTAVI